MNNNIAAHFSGTNIPEQGLNGVQSGLDAKQPIDLLSETISQWRERDRLDAVLLKAICLLTIEQPDQAQMGFTPWELVETVTRIRGRSWLKGNGKDQMADEVRRQWKKLEKLWESKKEGIREGLLDHGIQHYPFIERIEGGGTGKPTRYKVTWELSSAVIARAKVDPSASSFQKVDIRYICEDIQDAGLLAAIFTKGYEMVGWKKYVYRLTLIVPLLIIYLLFVLLIFSFTARTVLDIAAISSVVSFAVITVTAWYALNPLYAVHTKKITLAPWWMQSLVDDRLIELRVSPEHQTKSIKAVRYSAICPICNGKVYAISGGWAFFGRIVGKCEKSPVEHVFSFDHITRVGKYLR